MICLFNVPVLAPVAIPIELAVFLVSFISYVVLIHIYYTKKMKSLEAKLQEYITNSITRHAQTESFEYDMKQEATNAALHNFKQSQDKNDARFQKIDESLTQIKINVAEIRTLLKGTLDASDKNG